MIKVRKGFNMNRMLKILNDLTPLNRVFCSSDYDKAIEYLKDILPFKVISYNAADELNGWVIPPKWDIKEAKILKNGKVLYDGLAHPLRVISLSKSFEGEVDSEELKQHLHYDSRDSNSIPYHFRQQYRSWDRDWGFCVTKNFFDTLEHGKYKVIIETEESDGILKVLDYTHTGLLEETFAFVAHLDHPGMANDDLAGCAVGVELLKRLSKKRTKYSYKLLLVQEIIGSEHYWGRTNAGNKEKILESVFLEMLGTKTQLALQESLGATSNVEQAISKAMDVSGISYRRGPFNSIIGNDEYIWEAYGVPMASLSRFPYPEYHSDRDNFSIMSETALNEAVNVLLKAIEYLESSTLIFKKFQGNICLSNPKYDLYIDTEQPAFGNMASENVQKMRLLADLIPTLHQPTTVKVLSGRVGLPEIDVMTYLQKWVEKGLIELK